jgi:hypothetical protein
MADPDEFEGEDPESKPKPNWRRELEAKAKRGDEAVEELAQAQRELALHKAGLADLNDKQVKALAAAHEGDFTPEALQATATELGFTKPEPAEQEQPEVPSNNQPPENVLGLPTEQARGSEVDLEAIQRIAAASAGAPQSNADPLQEMLKRIGTDGQSQEDLMAYLRSVGLAQ